MRHPRFPQLLAATFALAAALALAAEDPAKAPPKEGAGAEAPEVFTNEDLAGAEAPADAGAEAGAADARAPRGARRRQAREAKAAGSAGAAGGSEDQKWDTWRRRHQAIQARVDAAQADVDRLEAQQDAANGDVERTSDGQKIQGVRPGRGFYLELESAKRRLTRATAELDRLQQQAQEAGVPPGVVR